MLDIHDLYGSGLEGARQTGVAVVKFVKETNNKKFRCFN